MRSKQAKKRTTAPDFVYNDRSVAKLINRIMISGKKTVAERHVYTALQTLKKDLNQDPIDVLNAALKNITPQMEVRSRRVGGAAYQVPMPVKSHRGLSLAIRWLVIEAKKRPNKDHHTFADKLVAEIKDALNNQGGAIQRKITSHKMADANKAFAHFRW